MCAARSFTTSATALARLPRFAKSAIRNRSFSHCERLLSTEDLENFESERELHLAQEYQDVVGMFRFAIETERRFYLANEVDVKVSADGVRPLVELTMKDAWVWDMYRKSRFIPNVRVLSYKDVNIEELPKEDL
jgi:hypothetical protein